MGRHPVRKDLRRKPRTFVLGDREMVLIHWFMEAHEVNKSEAVRAIFHAYEQQLNSAEKRELSLRRVALAAEARRESPIERPSSAPTRCPACGDPDLFVLLPNDHWRCDMCMARG